MLRWTRTRSSPSPSSSLPLQAQSPSIADGRRSDSPPFAATSLPGTIRTPPTTARRQTTGSPNSRHKSLRRRRHTSSSSARIVAARGQRPTTHRPCFARVVMTRPGPLCAVRRPFYIRRADTAHADLLGARLLSIDGKPCARCVTWRHSLGGTLPARSLRSLFPRVPDQMQTLGIAIAGTPPPTASSCELVARWSGVLQRIHLTPRGVLGVVSRLYPTRRRRWRPWSFAGADRSHAVGTPGSDPAVPHPPGSRVGCVRRHVARQSRCRAIDRRVSGPGQRRNRARSSAAPDPGHAVERRRRPEHHA